jgi:membrane-associated phospholipid phosphatase
MSSPVSSPPPRLISDELWALFEPLIPPQPPAVHGRTGRPRVSDRDVLEGIAFVLSTGIGWGQAADRARLRLGLDLLAADARMGRRRRVRPGASGRARPPRRGGAVGLVAGQPRLGQRPGAKMRCGGTPSAQRTVMRQLLELEEALDADRRRIGRPPAADHLRLPR